MIMNQVTLIAIYYTCLKEWLNQTEIEKFKDIKLTNYYLQEFVRLNT